MQVQIISIFRDETLFGLIQNTHKDIKKKMKAFSPLFCLLVHYP